MQYLPANEEPVVGLTVVGATNPVLNGTYTDVGDYGGKTLYKLSTGDYWLLWNSGLEMWQFHDTPEVGINPLFARADVNPIGAYTEINGTGNVVVS
ncbi:MAG: hypothetical protein AB7S72_20155 [Draconibacterium sp.]